MLFDPEKDVANSEAYIRDNIEATETLIVAMISENVPYLVYLGDTYANLEVEENYGLSEDNFSGIPKTFLTGEYGETKIRGEIFARKSVGRKLANGDEILKAVFPRSTFVYGEGDAKMMETFLAVCQRHQGCIPFFEGSSRGMFQYIYAGNLAGYLECCMNTLMFEPERCNGDYFYCMEDTKATKINEFFAPMLEAAGHSFVPAAGSWYLTFLSTFIYEFKEKIFGKTFKTIGKEFSRCALRFLFAYGYGFSNRKQQLTMDYRPEFTQSDGIKRTARWISANFGGEQKIVETRCNIKVLDKLSEIRYDENVLRMG
uniref:3-beta hydroxysteroid dehydrogenase/isomerase domain-containing protein n=1 Tax=Panagrolaimus sp. ES5 TaxID=591445 RepID=A0AC34F9S1_9BILA